MKLPTLYRRRFIPNETIELKDDEILYLGENIIVTRWSVLKPRSDFNHGLSCYYFDSGFKVSKFFKDGRLVYIYCDIIEVIHNPENNSYVFNDLLLDVIIYNDGFVKVMDVGEVALALDKGLIDIGMAKCALNHLDSLLKIIYAGNMSTLTNIFEKYN